MTRILIVEDNPLNLRLMETILTSNGYTCSSAIEGQSGVELAAAESFDLILMDLQLPDIDGYETTRRIRESDSRPFTPVIAVTGNTTAADQQNATDSGFDGFLKKPYRIHELLQVINEVLGIEAADLIGVDRDSS